MKTKQKTKRKTVLVRDLQIHDRLLYLGRPATVVGLARYGTSFHSLTVTLEVFNEWKQQEHHEVVFDTLHELESNSQTVKPKAKRKSPVVTRVENAGYSIEKVNGKWEVYHNDDHSVTAIYDRLRDIPTFAPYV